MENFGYVFASKMLVEGKNTKKVQFMYREAPRNPDDSGWSFFCGEEDNVYVSEPKNIGIYDIQTILERDSSVVPYLDSPPGSAFERENENDDFVSVADFVFGQEDN